MSPERTEQEFRDIYATVKTIAVVGASSDPSKAAFAIPRYLKSQGFRIIPVNPKGGEILGEQVRTSLADIDVPVDAKVLWLQEGIHSDEAQRIAEDAGLTFVSNRCMGETHWNLFHVGQEG